MGFVCMQEDQIGPKVMAVSPSFGLSFVGLEK
jgi:hypothetical protein